MPNEPYVEQIMVADGDGDNPDVEEVKYETVHDGGGGGGTNLDSLPDSTNDISDTDLIVSKENDGWVKKTALKLLQYIGIFYGTTAEWENLSLAEKDKYKLVVKTDDTIDGYLPKGNIITTYASKTGSAQSDLSTTIAADTTLDNTVETLLNNDATLLQKHTWRHGTSNYYYNTTANVGWTNTNIDVSESYGSMCSITFVGQKNSSVTIHMQQLLRVNELISANATNNCFYFYRPDYETVSYTILLCVQSNKLWIYNSLCDGTIYLSYFN